MTDGLGLVAYLIRSSVYVTGCGLDWISNKRCLLDARCTYTYIVPGRPNLSSGRKSENAKRISIKLAHCIVPRDPIWLTWPDPHEAEIIWLIISVHVTMHVTSLLPFTLPFYNSKSSIPNGSASPFGRGSWSHTSRPSSTCTSKLPITWEHLETVEHLKVVEHLETVKHFGTSTSIPPSMSRPSRLSNTAEPLQNEHQAFIPDDAHPQAMQTLRSRLPLQHLSKLLLRCSRPQSLCSYIPAYRGLKDSFFWRSAIWALWGTSHVEHSQSILLGGFDADVAF